MLTNRRLITAATAVLATLVAAAPAAAAKPIAYEGKTSAGNIGFKRSGPTVRDLWGYVPVACASTVTSGTKAGADSFVLAEPVTIGAGEVEQIGKYDTALSYGSADKTSRVTLTAGPKGTVKGKVVMSFMIFEPYYNAWGYLDANTFVCQGEGTFTAKPVAKRRG